jgi:hypothetical protein
MFVLMRRRSAEIEPHPTDSDDRMFGELTPPQLLDALVRCAEHRHRHRSEQLQSQHKSGEAEEEEDELLKAKAPPKASTWRLSDSVKHALQHEVLVGAVRTSVEDFRRTLSSTAVQQVLTQHKPRLVFVFRTYAALDTRPSADTTSADASVLTPSRRLPVTELVPTPSAQPPTSAAAAAATASAAAPLSVALPASINEAAPPLPSPLEHLSTINVAEFLTLAEVC